MTLVRDSVKDAAVGVGVVGLAVRISKLQLAARHKWPDFW